MAAQPALRDDHLRSGAATYHRLVARSGTCDRPGLLLEQTQIKVVARDRGGGYALAAAKALPKAIQVADRWHLMENASRAFLDAVRKYMRQIRAVIGAATINPDLLTSAERLQYEAISRGRTRIRPCSTCRSKVSPPRRSSDEPAIAAR
jgi:transposase